MLTEQQQVIQCKARQLSPEMLFAGLVRFKGGCSAWSLVRRASSRNTHIQFPPSTLPRLVVPALNTSSRNVQTYKKKQGQPFFMHRLTSTAVDHKFQVMLNSSSQRKILVRHLQVSFLFYSLLTLMLSAWQQLISLLFSVFRL